MKTTTYLEMKIEFKISDQSFKIIGDVKEDQQANILENFLYRQHDQGIDDRKPKEKEIYNFTVRWFPTNDEIIVLSDVGNFGARDGILMHITRKLMEKYEQ